MIILVCVGKTEEDGSVEFAIVAVSFVVDNDDVPDDDNVDSEDVDGNCSGVPDPTLSRETDIGDEISINVVLLAAVNFTVEQIFM